MNILVTNDDGIDSVGLHVLARALRPHGDVVVAAPDGEYSGSGASLGAIHLMQPELHRADIDGIDESWAISAPPAMCVLFSRLGAFGRRFDLVVSGINPNENIGHDVTYSGTVTAAMEAVIWGVNGIAVSLESGENHGGLLDYSTAAIVGRRVAEKVLGDGLPEGVLLNVNVPYLQESELKGYMITRQGLRVYRDELDARIDPRGKPYFWIGGEAPTGVFEDGTDFGALEDGYVSITPLQLDLTNYKAMDALKKWKF